MIGEIIFGVIVAAVIISFIVLFATKGWPEEQTRVLDKPVDEPVVEDIVIEDEIVRANPSASESVAPPTVKKKNPARYAKVKVQ